MDARRRQGVDGSAVVAASPRLRAVLRSLEQGLFSNGDVMLYQPILDSIHGGDWFMVGSDFDNYVDTQGKVSDLWQDTGSWTAKAIQNTVHMGWFSSDRTIREYARDIWNVPVE